MTVAEAIRAAVTRLAETSDTARLDAELLMAHALGVSRSDMLLRAMRESVPETFAALVARRERHEPVAYITGTAEFYGLTLAVTPATLIPRGDSETLIEVAREAFANRPAPRRILDLGTGSGALLLAAMSIWQSAEGVGLDQSAAALVVAIGNAQTHANTAIGVMGNREADLPMPRLDRGMARFIQRDWRKRGWAEDLGTFDLILCNPPYVEAEAVLEPQVRDHEPATALFAGPEGLDDYRVLIPQLGKLLVPGGVAVFEIGAGQADAVSAIASAAGFTPELRHDLAGRPRVLTLR
ncbi:peptide chain release factor N(5)-glutamine methyltransferase [Erythrobacter sp.]|uniref:peptide chain release factor N(5)-glutamine methyltransferase n=1 Tax=Erythrobacter sp. TaxID=1042 RepID=UPI0025D81448|nr:peptide chain release factor N(5)-glutamine methyltransferase [Erythrobacter sp.]